MTSSLKEPCLPCAHWCVGVFSTKNLIKSLLRLDIWNTILRLLCSSSLFDKPTNFLEKPITCQEIHTDFYRTFFLYTIMYAWKGHKLIRTNIRVFLSNGYNKSWKGGVAGLSYTLHIHECAQLSTNLMYVGKVTEKGTVLCLT